MNRDVFARIADAGLQNLVQFERYLAARSMRRAISLV